MTTLTLLTRIYNTHQLKHMDQTLSDLLEGLSVEAKIIDTPAHRWVQLELLGEDEQVATNLLEKETGFCPVSLETIRKFSALRGYVINVEKSKDKLLLDVGVFQPKIVNVAIPLKRLQTQLAEGKNISLKQIAELWGISENLPLNIKVLDINSDEGPIQAELQVQQVKKYLLWKESLLDRLIILGEPLSEINLAVEQAGLIRDIIDIEPLGMFEFALVCKLGTDAAGLIGSIGRRLRKAKFTVFNPKKIKF